MSIFEFNVSEFLDLHEFIKKAGNVFLKKDNKVEIGSLLEKIFVHPPYFAFEDIRKDGEIWVGKFKAEQPIYLESTPISSAEASRHMAILGSCALSELTKEKKYYLAVKARKNQGIDIKKVVNKKSNEQQFYVFAKAISISDKEGVAITSITDSEGNIIFDFKVGYLILKENVFARLFKKHQKVTNKISYNPYNNLPDLKDVRHINESTLSAVLEKISPEKCAGHFNNFPIWPVGVMAYICIKTVGSFLQNITNNPNLVFFLHSAKMDVIMPPSIEEDAKFILFFNEKLGNKYSFSWVMIDQKSSEILNTMHIAFEVLSN